MIPDDITLYHSTTSEAIGKEFCALSTFFFNDRVRKIDVTEYTGELECIWREIDHYRPALNPNSEERQYTLKDRMYKYLMGLNLEYETLVNQILAREKVPNFEEALKLVVKEESTRHLRSDQKANPKSAVFAARRGKEL